MSEPELKFEIDEYGRIGYRVTNEGVLLSKDEKEFIIDHITRMQAENVKLRELVDGLTWCCNHHGCKQECPLYDMSEPDHCREVSIKRELGVEVDDG